MELTETQTSPLSQNASAKRNLDTLEDFLVRAQEGATPWGHLQHDPQLFRGWSVAVHLLL